MTLPSEEAIEAAQNVFPRRHWIEKEETCRELLEAAYAIDAAPLRARIGELEEKLERRRYGCCCVLDKDEETILEWCAAHAAERDRMKEHLNYYSGQELLHGTHKDLVEKCEKLKEELAILNKAYVRHMQKIDEELAEAKELLDYAQYRVGPEMKKEIEVFLSIHAPAKEREQ